MQRNLLTPQFIIKGRLVVDRNLRFCAKALETATEARKLPGFNKFLLTARPSWVRVGINVQRHSSTFFAPSTAGSKQRAVGHLHGYNMIIGVNFGLHNNLLFRILIVWRQVKNARQSALCFSAQATLNRRRGMPNHLGGGHGL